MAKHGDIKDKTWGDINPSDKHMFGWRGTGKQESGQSASEGTGSKRGIAPHAGSSNVAYVSDNSKHGKTMSEKAGKNTDYAGTATPGGSGPTKSGGDNRFAEGGKTHMWGNRGSRRAVEGQSGPNG